MKITFEDVLFWFAVVVLSAFSVWAEYRYYVGVAEEGYRRAIAAEKGTR